MCIVLKASVLVTSEGLTVEKDGGQGCYDITMGQKEKADSRLKAE